MKTMKTVYKNSNSKRQFIWFFIVFPSSAMIKSTIIKLDPRCPTVPHLDVLPCAPWGWMKGKHPYHIIVNSKLKTWSISIIKQEENQKHITKKNVNDCWFNVLRNLWLAPEKETHDTLTFRSTMTPWPHSKVGSKLLPQHLNLDARNGSEKLI